MSRPVRCAAAHERVPAGGRSTKTDGRRRQGGRLTALSRPDSRCDGTTPCTPRMNTARAAQPVRTPATACRAAGPAADTAPSPLPLGDCATPLPRWMVKGRIRPTVFGIAPERCDRTSRPIECADGRSRGGSSHRQCTGRNTPIGDTRRDDVAVFNADRHPPGDGQAARASCCHTDRPLERRMSSTALRERCRHGSLLPEDARATSMP